MCLTILWGWRLKGTQWELLLVCTGVSDNTHMNELNQINVFTYVYPITCKATSYLSSFLRYSRFVFLKQLGMSDHTHLK